VNGVVLPAPTAAPSLFPGAILSSTGLYRYEMAGGAAPVAVVSGNGGRIWFAGADGTIRTIDPASGNVAIAAHLGRARIDRLAFGGDRLFALDTRAGDLYILNTTDLSVRSTGQPFAQSVSGMDVGPDGRLWLASSTYSGVLVYDPKTAQFEFTLLDRTSPVAISVDSANRVWFYDARQSALTSYEPSTKRLSSFGLAVAGTVTALRADRAGEVWLGTSTGAVYRAFAGSLTTVRSAGYPAVAYAPAPDGSLVALFNVSGSTLFGDPAGTALAVGSGGITALAVDGQGRIWLADSGRPVFYIAPR